MRAAGEIAHAVAIEAVAATLPVHTTHTRRCPSNWARRVGCFRRRSRLRLTPKDPGVEEEVLAVAWSTMAEASTAPAAALASIRKYDLSMLFGRTKVGSLGLGKSVSRHWREPEKLWPKVLFRREEDSKNYKKPTTPSSSSSRWSFAQSSSFLPVPPWPNSARSEEDL